MQNTSEPSLTQLKSSDEAYRQAGVDLKSAEAVVGFAKNAARKTARHAHVLGGIGGFSGGFEIPPGYREPVMLCACDGVGTKLKLAFESNQHNTVGIDLVAMSVNDILVSGGKPLVFLDYLATQKILPEQLEPILDGVAEGCVQAECALIGGETAEMPGFYTPGEYDLAGFCVGIAEKSQLYPRTSQLSVGDSLIGLPSSGLHSNGFSLVRKVLWTDNALDPNTPLSQLGLAIEEQPNASLMQALLEPTRIYVKSVLNLLEAMPNAVKAMVHVTGGGFYDNISRVLPDNLQATIDADSWVVPPLMRYLQQLGGLSDETLYHTFNCGIGYILIVDPTKADAVKLFFDNTFSATAGNPQGTKAIHLGTLTTRDPNSDAVVIR